MASDIFLAEVLNGLARGFVTGMQIRQRKESLAADRKLRERELGLRERKLDMQEEQMLFPEEKDAPTAVQVASEISDLERQADMLSRQGNEEEAARLKNKADLLRRSTVFRQKPSVQAGGLTISPEESAQMAERLKNVYPETKISPEDIFLGANKLSERLSPEGKRSLDSIKVFLNNASPDQIKAFASSQQGRDFLNNLFSPGAAEALVSGRTETEESIQEFREKEQARRETKGLESDLELREAEFKEGLERGTEKLKSGLRREETKGEYGYRESLEDLKQRHKLEIQQAETRSEKDALRRKQLFELRKMKKGHEYKKELERLKQKNKIEAKKVTQKLKKADDKTKVFEKIREKITTGDSYINKLRLQNEGIKDALTLLEEHKKTGNTVVPGALSIKIVRGLGEVGNIARGEHAMGSESAELVRRLEDWYLKASSGRISDRTVGEIERMLSTIDNRVQAELKKHVEQGYVTPISRIHGIPEEEIRQKLNIGALFNVSTKKSGAKSVPTTENRAQDVKKGTGSFRRMKNKKTGQIGIFEIMSDGSLEFRRYE